MSRVASALGGAVLAGVVLACGGSGTADLFSPTGTGPCVASCGTPTMPASTQGAGSTVTQATGSTTSTGVTSTVAATTGGAGGDPGGPTGAARTATGTGTRG